MLPALAFWKESILCGRCEGVRLKFCYFLYVIGTVACLLQMSSYASNLLQMTLEVVQ